MVTEPAQPHAAFGVGGRRSALHGRARDPRSALARTCRAGARFVGQPFHRL